MTDARSRTVLVCLPRQATADWFTASEVVDHHLHTAGTPLARFPIRHRRILGWITRWRATHLLDARRRFGAVTFAAGGRVNRLDLTAAIARARDEATYRWRIWFQHIAATTQVAKPYQFFLAQHEANPDKVSLDEAKRRFEAQPRVLAMLALSGHPVATVTFDPYELEVYQAGEATYVAFHWRHVVAGDALVTVEGTLLRPLGPTLADRLRYQHAAASYVHQLSPRQHLVALNVD